MESQEMFKCGFCGWLLKNGTLDFKEHLCFSHFDEQVHQFTFDENYVVTLELKESFASQIEDSDNNSFTQQESDFESDQFYETLISLVSERPPLYDYTTPVPQRTHLKKQALWQEIHNSLGGSLTVEEIKKKWKYLRDCYQKALKKEKEYIPSGSKGVVIKSRSGFRFYEMMSFLNVTENTRQTVTNLPDDIRAKIKHKKQPLVESEEANSDISSPGVTPRAKRRKTDERKIEEKKIELQYSILEAIQNSNKDSLDEVDAFLMRLSAGMKRLPYQRRAELEIKYLTLLQEYENRYVEMHK